MNEDFRAQIAEMHLALARPFEGVKFKPGGGGRDMPYITARDVMNRLDEVFGIDGWWDEYVPLADGAICKLSVLFPDGNVVTKSDVGGNAGMQDAGDDDKSGFSDAFKRAGVKFGVGRWLYGNGLPSFMEQFPQPTRNGGGGYSGGGNNGGYNRSPAPPPQQAPPPSNGGYNRNGNGGGNGYTGPNNPPRTGKALFAWAMKEKDNGNPDALRSINDFGKANGLGDRMVQWPDDAVADAYAAVTGGGRQQQPAGHPSQQPVYTQANDDGPDF